MLKAAIVGEIWSGSIGTDFTTAGSDYVGVVVSSSAVAAPPRKLFSKVAKNSVNASWATWKRASVATGVLSSRGGASRPYGRGMVRSYVGRSSGLIVSSSSESNSFSWYGRVSIQFSSSGSVSFSSFVRGSFCRLHLTVNRWETKLDQ